MEFLKAILGDDLYKQIETALNTYNGNPENKDKQIKLANLATGEYVGKGKYSTLEAEKATADSKLAEANTLIEQLKKAAKGDEGLQGKVTAYEAKITELEQQLAETKLDAAIKVGLLAEKAVDVDYLTFKLKEKDEKLELDEQGNIKGWADKVAALKTQLPAQFNTDAGNGSGFEGFRPLDKDGKPAEKALTKEEFLKRPYREQLKYYNENPEGYAELMKS